MRKVEPLDTPPFRLGARVRISQPRAPTQVWMITDLDEAQAFTWEAKSPGGTSIAGHAVEFVASGSRVILCVRQRGFEARLLGFWLRPLIRRNLELEAAGLKARCEGS